ncbi:hypothetical protein NOU13_24710 [Rhodococcus erythropolis]|uniref:hypothetical protein n=1 Tax=Rhodococcus erythropolis TaxID=1833 RepID=UPI000F73F77E|nr:hypothetical protein [Rhodococcus erythropolis]MCQ4127704.1 hypothetical protein [Rhodococcus erythropolis]
MPSLSVRDDCGRRITVSRSVFALLGLSAGLGWAALIALITTALLLAVGSIPSKTEAMLPFARYSAWTSAAIMMFEGLLAIAALFASSGMPSAGAGRDAPISRIVRSEWFRWWSTSIVLSLGAFTGAVLGLTIDGSTLFAAIMIGLPSIASAMAMHREGQVRRAIWRSLRDRPLFGQPGGFRASISPYAEDPRRWNADFVPAELIWDPQTAKRYAKQAQNAADNLHMLQVLSAAVVAILLGAAFAAAIRDQASLGSALAAGLLLGVSGWTVMLKNYAQKYDQLAGEYESISVSIRTTLTTAQRVPR